MEYWVVIKRADNDTYCDITGDYADCYVCDVEYKGEHYELKISKSIALYLTGQADLEEDKTEAYEQRLLSIVA